MRAVMFLFGGLMLSTASVAHTHARSDTDAPANSASDSRQADAKPPHCNELDLLYFHYFPGVVAACYGKRKWMQGHYRSAISDFKLAAGWGSKSAQYSLGLIYYNGRHVTADKSLGIAWLKLAAERHDASYEMVARSAEKWATPRQRRHARELLSRMRQRYGDKVAAKRAWTHYRHGIRYDDMAQMVAVGPTCQTLPGGNGEPARCIDRDKFKHRLRLLASYYFDGWQGLVQVGPLQEMPASASSSGH